MNKLAPLMQQQHPPLSDPQPIGDSSSASAAAPDVVAGSVDTTSIQQQQQSSHRIPVYDQNWVEATTKRAQNKLEKLDTDLKHYKNNSIKESIRRGQVC